MVRPLFAADSIPCARTSTDWSSLLAAVTLIEAREPPKENFVNFYYKKAYATEGDDVEKRSEDFVDFYYKKAYATEGDDVEKRSDDDFVGFYYKKAYATEDATKA